MYRIARLGGHLRSGKSSIEWREVAVETAEALTVASAEQWILNNFIELSVHLDVFTATSVCRIVCGC